MYVPLIHNKLMSGKLVFPMFSSLINGVMSASFHWSGICPCYTDGLNLMRSICEYSVANSFGIFLVMSGPEV